MTERLERPRWTRVQSQILVWCGDEPETIGYDGATIVVPPVSEVAKPGIRSPYRLPSATTKHGVPLPGTVLVEDVIIRGDSGGWRKVFDVSDLCEYLERDEPQLFARGFAIVSDPEDVRAVQMELRPLYEASLDERARHILTQELQRRKKLEQAGEPITPGSNHKDVAWAYRHQQKRAAELRKQEPQIATDDIHSALEGHFSVPTAAPSDVETPAAAPTPAENVSAASLIDEAAEVGVTLSKADLQGLIRGDKETYDYVVEKIKLKRTA